MSVHALMWDVPPSDLVMTLTHYPSDVKKRKKEDIRIIGITVRSIEGLLLHLERLG